MVRYQGERRRVPRLDPAGRPGRPAPLSKNFIDDLVFANLKRIGVPLRRCATTPPSSAAVTLDIAGRLPTDEEAKAFLASSDPAKRDQVIDELLKTPDYADYFAAKWTALLKNRRDDASDIVSNFAFHAWVRDSLLANKPYDQFVCGTPGRHRNGDRQSAGRLVQAGQGAEAADRGRRAALPRRPDAMRRVPPPPLRTLEPGRLLRLAAFFSQVGRKPSGVREQDLIFHKQRRGDGDEHEDPHAGQAGGPGRRRSPEIASRPGSAAEAGGLDGASRTTRSSPRPSSTATGSTSSREA